VDTTYSKLNIKANI